MEQIDTNTGLEYVTDLFAEEETNTVQESSAGPLKTLATQIGCCDLYRQCSDAGHCISTDEELKSSCVYNLRLQEGMVFYGKHATTFDKDVYNEFVAQYNTLNESEASVLRSLLHLFFHENRGQTRGLFIEMQEFSVLEQCRFISLPYIPRDIVSRMRMKTLRVACGDRISDAEKWAMARCSEKELKERTTGKTGKPKKFRILQSELVQWIILNAPDIAKGLCKGVQHVEIQLKTRPELEEFYIDFIQGQEITSCIRPYTDDQRFLNSTKPDEEDAEEAES